MGYQPRRRFGPHHDIEVAGFLAFVGGNPCGSRSPGDPARSFEDAPRQCRNRATRSAPRRTPSFAASARDRRCSITALAYIACARMPDRMRIERLNRTLSCTAAAETTFRVVVARWNVLGPRAAAGESGGALNLSAIRLFVSLPGTATRVLPTGLGDHCGSSGVIRTIKCNSQAVHSPRSCNSSAVEGWLAR